MKTAGIKTFILYTALAVGLSAGTAAYSQTSGYPSNPFSFRIDTDSTRFMDTFFTVDLTNDGLPDYTFRTLDKLFVYDHYGSKLWEAAIRLPLATSGAKHAAADVDGDGQIEIAALDTGNTIIIFNGRTGSVKRTFRLTAGDSTGFVSHIAIADLRGRGDRDAILQTSDFTNEHYGYEYYINRTVFAVNLETGQDIWPERIRQDRNIDYPAADPDSIYEGYWGQAHGPFFAADIDGDGRDEVIGATMIDDDGTLISLNYPTDWINVYVAPMQKELEFIDHLDAIAVGDLRPDLPGLEWVMCEEDHNGQTNEWNTTLISGLAPEPVIWRRETNLFDDLSEREPQNIAIGNYDTTRALSEVWLRSRMGDAFVSQQPWVFDSQGRQFSWFYSGTALPDGFHQLSNNHGLEMIWTIDWFGTKKEYIAAQSRHKPGDVGVFAALHDHADSPAGNQFPAAKPLLTHDTRGTVDHREEVIICDSTDTGPWIRIYTNDTVNSHQPKADKWADPLYRRLKQNWNYYSPGSYTTPDYPVISDIEITGVLSNGFTVSWKTDIPADSRIEYGLSDMYGSTTPLDTARVTNHSLTVSGLGPGTEYHYRIHAASAFGTVGATSDRQATTDLRKQLAFITAPQSLYAGTVSAPVSIQLQTTLGEPRTLASDIIVRLSSSSSGGSFSLDPYSWQNDTEVTIPAHVSTVSFYYRDTAAGNPLISIREEPGQDWVRNTQRQTILAPSARHAPHTVFGTVVRADSSPPAAEDLHFSAYMAADPSRPLTETDRGCGYNGETWWLECANFAGGWGPGEQLIIAFIDSAGGGKDTLLVPLTTTAPQNGGQASLGIDPPWFTGIEISGQSSLTISWNEMPGVIGYNVYKNGTLPFTPDTEGGSNRAASMVSDENASLAGVQWTDTSAPVGNPASNCFYIVTAVTAAEESRFSRVIGAFDYDLSVGGGTGLNMIGLPLRSLSPAVTTAEDLSQQIPACTSVSRWLASAQGYQQYLPAIPSSDFAVSPPDAYGVHITASGVYTLLGEYVEPSFELVTTSGTDFNYFTMPLTMGNISTAAGLIQSIPGANSLAAWDNLHQTYIQYIPELPFSNFSVRPGYPYIVNVIKNSIWPGTAGSPAPVQGSAAGGTIHRNHGTGGADLPHAVWGRVSSTTGSMPDEWNFKAGLSSAGTKTLDRHSPGCRIEGDTWLVQCRSLPDSWQPGDTLHVEFFTAEGVFLAKEQVILSDAPADRAADISIAFDAPAPADFQLLPNYPNPFNSQTRLGYALPEAAQDVSLRIYNIKGQLVKEIFRAAMAAGMHEHIWDGRDSYGQEARSGLYLAVLKAGTRSEKIKIMLMR